MGGCPRAEPTSVDSPWPAALWGARVQRRLRSSPTSCCAVSPAPHLGVVALRGRLPRLRCPCVPAGAAPGSCPPLLLLSSATSVLLGATWAPLSFPV